MNALLVVFVSFADKSPEPEDVKAGWGAFALFLLWRFAPFWVRHVAHLLL